MRPPIEKPGKRFLSEIQDVEKGLTCPQCGTPLPDGSQFVCADCSKHWSVKDDIPLYGAYEGLPSVESADSELSRLVDVAETDGWETALYEYTKARVTRNGLAYEDQRVADWKYLLPLSRDSVVMVVGCGLGTVPVSLAETCGRVYAVDPTWEKVCFLNARKKQQGIDNLFPIFGSRNLDFPFARGQFDLIAIVGTFEWVTMRSGVGGLRAAQVEALQHIHGLLKQDGRLYFTADNRFGYQHLFGGMGKSWLRLAGVISRSVAKLATRVVKREGLGTQRYSIRGYKKLLREAGFGNTDFYAPLPKHTGIPLFHLPLHNDEAMRYFFSNIFPLFEMVSPEVKGQYGLQYPMAKIGARLALRFRGTKLAKYFAPGFSIIATE